MIKPVETPLARRSLGTKGFVVSTKGNRDHEMYFFELDGKKTNLFFKISRGAREVRRDEIRNSARTMKIPGDDLYRILCCEHDAKTTEALYRGALDPG